MFNDDDFDRSFDHIWKFSGLIVALSVIIGLALSGVAIWAIIALVLHFT